MVLVDSVDGEDSVLADERMTVLEAGSDRRNERLEELRLAHLLQEAKSRAADVLVGMLQVVTDGVTAVSRGREGDLPDENHLLLELAIVVELGADSVVSCVQTSRSCTHSQ